MDTTKLLLLVCFKVLMKGKTKMFSVRQEQQVVTLIVKEA
jgi:hypothetical protein